MTVVYGDAKTINGNFQFRAVVDYTVTANTETTWTVKFKMYGDYRSSNGSYAEAYTMTWFRYWRDPGDAQNWDTQYADDLYEPQTTRSTSWTSLTVAYDTVSITKGHSEKTFKLSSEYAYITDDPSSVKEVLLTIPAKPSYAVSYNANGGTGAPAAQTKWYGETLTIASSQPTRAGHRFVGWDTSSAATSASYSPGSSYTGNAALSLYAVWEKLPVISNVSVSRTDAYGSADEAGGYATITADYQSDFAITSATASLGSLSVSLGSRAAGSGTFSATVGDGTNVMPLTAYTATVSATSSAGTSSASANLPASSTYTRPTVSATLRRVASTSSTTQDDLGRYLVAVVEYAVMGTGSQTSPTSLVTRYATLEQSDVSHLLPTSAASGTRNVYSPIFAYSTLAPGAELPNEFTATVSDKFYSSSITVGLPAGTYFEPRLPNVSAYRSEDDGDPSDEGTTATVTIDWEVFASGIQTGAASLSVAAYDTGGDLVASRSLATSGTSGTEVMTFTSSDRASGQSGNIFDTEQKYSITATLTDLYTSTSRVDVLSTAYFTLDILAGGHGIAMGKPASTAELLDVSYEVHSDTEVSATDSNDVVHKLTEKANRSEIVAGVSGVKGDAESTYRTGNVNITAANIGAQPAGTYVTGVKGNSETDYRSGNVNLTAANIGAAAASHTHNYAGSDSSGGTANHAYHLTGTQPQLASSYEANEVTIRQLPVGTPNNYGYGEVHGIDFKWYSTHWLVGNLRGGSTNSEGVCFQYSGDDGSSWVTEAVFRPSAGLWLRTPYLSFRAVLYDNSSGTNGTVSLSASAANYNHMRIYCRDNDSIYGATHDIYSPNGKVVTLNETATNVNGFNHIKNRVVTISGTSITTKGSQYSEDSSRSNCIYIVRVEGWNE